ncbi:MAG TPA: MarR family winged helix-turn-helix transcriptional regulator [Chloroflexota bacterium]|nr:MarR family winged helix-turn-helix transcriptional regulator [Chloroflexota bacterium]
MNDELSAQAADEEPDQHLLNFQIGGAYRALVVGFERFVGITVARFRVLHAFGNTREVSQAWLQQRLGLDAASITRQVKAMEAEGLAVRRADPADNRFTLVALTEKGRSTANTVLPMAEVFGARLQAGCDPQELAIASRLLELVRQRALDLAAAPPIAPEATAKP